MQNYDYIVVGSGSSGSVIANRLSEIKNINVCVIEAGGSNQHPFIKMPAGFIKTINYETIITFFISFTWAMLPRGEITISSFICKTR